MKSRAAEVGGPSLHPIAAITIGQHGKELTEMAELRDAGAVGVSDDGVCVMSSAVMRRAPRIRQELRLAVIQHAEDHELTAGADMHEGAVSTKLGLRGWPRIAEDVIIARDVPDRRVHPSPLPRGTHLHAGRRAHHPRSQVARHRRDV